MVIITQTRRAVAGETGEASGIKRSITAIAVFMAGIFASNCSAFDSPKPGYISNITFAPQLELRGVYSDNLFLTDNNKQSDFVTVVSPGINIVSDGARARFNFTYILQGLLYASESEFNDINNRLAGSGNIELYKDHLFLDVDGTVGQENIANFGARQQDNINVFGDRRDVSIYTISPYWLQRYGNYADIELRLRHNEIDIADDDLNDTIEDQFLASVTSGRRFARLEWELYAEATNVSFGQGPDSKFNEISGEVAYLINARYAVFGTLGYEDNDFPTTSNMDLSGSIWNVGARWTLGPRTRMELSYGERFFGANVFFDLQHTSRRTTWILNYSKEATLASEQIARRGAFAVVDDIADIIIDPDTGDPLPIDGELANFSNEVFIREIFTGGVDLNGRRTNVSIRGYVESRDFSITQEQQDVNGLYVFATRALNLNTTLTASFGWSRGESTVIQPFQTYDGALGAIRQMSSRLSVALAYNYRHRDSDTPNDDFTENRIDLTALIIF